MTMIHATPRRWTVDEYWSLFEQGIFSEDERVELVEGQIVTRPSMNPPHRTAVMHGTSTLVEHYGHDYWVRVQLPLTLSDFSEPVPDFALVPKLGFDEKERPPRVALVIEVSDSSLSFDRDEKSQVYARGGVPEYWIVNLKAHQVEVHHDPARKPTARTPWRTHLVVPLDGELAPRCYPTLAIPVKDLF